MDSVIEKLAAALEGRYRVERELGEGGMATVYLAEDLKHRRRVAIKVLKPNLAAVVGKERFFAEIETTAQLQHPNILPLFDSGEAGGLLFYAMPYVEGETLEQRLAREHQLPVDTAVDLARKLASALDYAHQRGVVHRDVKPANVLMSSGEPLIADFGIALALTHAGQGRITETGLSLGTPHYMSPEQASGDRSLDPRSDIYALGCVLYEMLTGDPPFPGSSAQAVLARILTSAPSRVTLSRPTVPANVDAVIARALEKLPADRFSTAADFKKALDEPTFRHTPAASVQPTAAAATVPPRRRQLAVPVLGGLLVVSLAFAAWGWLRPEPVAPVVRLRLDVDALDMDGRDVVISPDGKVVVYVGRDQQLYQRPLDALEGLPITGARPVRDPFFSPDGTHVGFNFGNPDNDRIATVALSGGSPITLGDPAGGITLGGAWSEDDFVYWSAGNNMTDDPRFMRAPAQGGVAEVVETDIQVVRPAAIQGMTDRLLVVNRETDVGVGMLDLTTGAFEPIAGLESAYSVQYAGDFVFWLTVDDVLAAARFDPKAARLTSVPVTLAEGITPDAFTVSRTGTLIFTRIGASGTGSGEIPGWIDRSGVAQILDERLGTIEVDYDDVRLSKDGRYLALEVQRGSDGAPDEEHRVLIFDIDQGTYYQLTFEGAFNTAPRWMTDGRVAYYSDQSGRNGIWAQPYDRSGVEALIFDTELDIGAFDVAPMPGAPLAVTLYPQADSADFRQGIYLVDEAGGEPRPFVATRAEEGAPAISPDGHWLAYDSDETGRPQVYVRAFPDNGRPWPITTEPSGAPIWGPDGNEILYLAPTGVKVATLEIDDGIRVVSTQPLFSGNYELGEPGQAQYDVAPDGRLVGIFERGAVAQATGDSTPALPLVVLNVFEELRARLGETRR